MRACETARNKLLGRETEMVSRPILPWLSKEIIRFLALAILNPASSSSITISRILGYHLFTPGL